MKNPISTLRETAQNFNNIGSIASTQKHLLEIAEALEDEASGRGETQGLLEEETEALNQQVELNLILQNDNEMCQGELQKSQSLNQIYETETLEQFKERLKARG